MTPREFHLDRNEDAQAAMREAVAALEAGQLALLPDECGWSLLGLATAADAARQLSQATGNSHSGIEAVSLADPQVLGDYLDDPPPLFNKLASRSWPGPVVLCAGTEMNEGLARHWSAESQNWAACHPGRAWYCPADAFTHQLLRHVSAPALSLIGQGEPPSSAAVIVQSSASRFQEPPTRVRIEGNRFRVDLPGVVSERMLARLAGEIYLFVCTGNTCRSPMAEALFRKMLVDRLQCREDELLDRGFVVISAGLAARPGMPAAPEAVELLRQDGIELSAHESQPLTEELLFHSDHILTMTRSHRDAVLSAYPELADQVRVLSPTCEDISDPIGAGIDEYTRCREEIVRHLHGLLEEIDFSPGK